MTNNTTNLIRALDDRHDLHVKATFWTYEDVPGRGVGGRGDEEDLRSHRPVALEASTTRLSSATGGSCCTTVDGAW